MTPNNNQNQPASSAAKHPLDNYTVQPQNNNDGGDKSPYYHSSAPSISLPKGGGALKGIDEKFSVNAVNGTAGLSVPLPLSPGRSGFTPSLALSYNSGGGNSEFGLAWGLGLPAIQRKTDKQLPLYDDMNERDVFLLAGAEDLVPQLKENGDEDEFITPDLLFVKRYRPRIEGLFARIEFIKNRTGASWWRVTTKDNITTYYGSSANSRLCMPDQPANTFKWLPELVVDGKGNVQQYIYKPENLDEVPVSLHERNRWNSLALCTNLYLKRVRYCNLAPYYVEEGDQYSPIIPTESAVFLMEAVMDYGEHTNADPLAIPSYQPINNWQARTDPFSDYHAGFEIRTYRRCHRILMFHRFDEITDNSNPEILVRSLDLTYQNGQYHEANPYTEADLITTITQTGYQKADAGWIKDALPAMTMAYEPLQWNNELKNVSPTDTINAPQGLTGPYQWTDLWGEGLPGILSEQGQNWWYKTNLGDGHFSPAQPIAEKPSFAGMASGALQWQDLDADGRRQVVIHSKGIEGFFELDDDQLWHSFQSFKEKANVDWNSPYTKMLDMNGDGRPDLLLTNDNVWTWYENEGKIGFTEGGQANTLFDEEKGPRLVLNDKVQSIYLADMSGDGMTDIVRIKNGEVCYWPNIGYGKFGAKVAMSNAPTFDHPDLFNPLYLQLTDISGTGAADLVYLGASTFKAWINLAGNAFSEAHDIATFPGIEPYSKVALLDFLGNGTGCIVWSSPLPQHSHAPMRYIDLMGGKKPYLMNSYENGMGKSVAVTYKSSTRFYLEDKAAGTPWATRLPFPVQCIDQISTHDVVSDTTFTQTYHYHHGYYDHEEREFRGFGRVDVLDTDSTLIPNSQFPIPNSLNQPPVLTKTWYHTGAWMREKTLLDAFKQEYYQCEGWDELATQATFFGTLNAQEQREAYRALKGAALRQEVYALDGDPDKEQHPYTVAVSSYCVKPVQYKWNNRYASFLTYPDQSLAFSCERMPEDTRVAHTLTLLVDEYGNVLESAQVAYPRKTAVTSLPQKVQDEQAKMHMVYSQNNLTGDVVDDLNYRLRVPWEGKTFEVTGLPTPTGLWTTSDLERGISLATQTLLSHSITFFAMDTDLTQSLDAGVLSVLAIPYQQYTLAFTQDILDDCYDGRVSPIMLGAKGGYLCEKNIPGYGSSVADSWWVPSGSVAYGSNPKSRFYTPVYFTDPWGNETSITYWANYFLLPKMVTDAKGNNSQVLAYNWYNLQPERMEDANENLSEICYDVLGMPVATAIVGKGTEADYLKTLAGAKLVPGITGDGTNDTLAQETFWDAGSTVAQVEAAAKTLLGRATWRTIYNLKTQPTAVAMIGREQHYQDNNASNVVIRVSYSDSFGRIALSKAQCRETTATLGSTTFTANWVCSGKTIYNNKGKPVMQYEPFFCGHHSFNHANYQEQVGVSPEMYYDPLGRPFKTVMPNGSYSFTTWDNWQQTVYDANDTTSVSFDNGATYTESDWFTARNNSVIAEEADAASKAYAHANTPTVMHLDSLARPFFTVQDDGINPLIHSYENLDIQGSRMSVIDGRGLTQLQYRYNLLKAPGYQHSIDGGEGRMLMDVAGQPLVHWDADERMFSTEYDELRRPIQQWLNDSLLLEKTLYADGPIANAGANLRGKVLEHYDASGKQFVDAYDFKGLPIRSYQQLLVDGTLTDVNWKPLVAPALSSETFTTTAVMDALGRPVSMTDAGGNETTHFYDRGGALMMVKLNGDTYVQDIHHDAKGQRKAIWYGNGTKTNYSYDPLTYRLTRLLTVNLNPSPHVTVQDLNYYYDAVGNITRIRDKAQQDIYFNNTVVSADQDYTYDALYRLISAEGREQIGVATFGTNDNYNDTAWITSHKGSGGSAVQRYTQTYTYDEVGNILSLQHSAGSNGYTRTFTYTNNSNRLIKTKVGSDPDYDYTYDARGNMALMPHMSVMDWNSENQLQHITAGSTDAYYQYSGGQRIRKVIEKTGQTEERIYLGSFEIYRKYDGMGDVVIERTTVHVNDDTGRIAMLEVRTEGDADDDNDTPEELKRFVYSNHLQSAALELDEDAEVISYEEYHPYGTTSYQAMDATINATAKRYRFTGKERDDESGLNYHGARYYAPWLCRWTAVDPLETKYVPWSSYNYGFDSPNKYNDLTGMGPGNTDEKTETQPIKTYFIDSNSGKNLGELPGFEETESRDNISLPQTGINLRAISKSDFDAIKNGELPYTVDDGVFLQETGVKKYKYGESIKVDGKQIETDLKRAADMNTKQRNEKEQVVTIIFDRDANLITSKLLPDSSNTNTKGHAFEKYAITRAGNDVATFAVPTFWGPFTENTSRNFKGDLINSLNAPKADGVQFIIGIAHTHPAGDEERVTLNFMNPTAPKNTNSNTIVTHGHSEEDYDLLKSTGLPNFIIKTYVSDNFSKIPVDMLQSQASNKEDMKHLGTFNSFINHSKVINNIINFYK